MLLTLYIVCLVIALTQGVQPAPLDEVTSEFVCIERVCYSIIWEEKRFAKARTGCESKDGQLLTVKNSVQQDAIALFMSKVEKDNVRVWIGLEQPYRNKCTDELQPLRGFTWVTGDSYTDYTNWKSSGQQKCGALCVTVNKDGTWEETDCGFRADGYLCELNYQVSCSPLALPTDLDVTYVHTSLGLGRSGGPVFPPGTNAFISTFPDALHCQGKGDGHMAWSSDTPGAWSCLIENGGCEGMCDEMEGIARCSCPPGSPLKADNRTCSKPCDPNPCSQFCVPITESPGYTCMCSEGYYLADDGKTCIDIDDCEKNPNICEHHCTNTIGSFVCGCKPGYELVMDPDCGNPDGCPSECLDIDECINPLTLCEHDCRNIPGGYVCVCAEGFVVDEMKPYKCKRFCNTSFCEADCDINIKDKCQCPDGYVVDENDQGEPICTDIDECEASPCDGFCTNLFGSFECSCPEGFIAQKTVCISLEEGSGTTETWTVKPSSKTPPTKSPPPDFHSLQPAMLLGICIGIISLLTVLIAILCHMLRKHYMEQHALDYKTKNTEKGVVLQQVKTDPQR
ncbi:thrombomodulin-like [Hyperolius riggenbachi]|uniref:thrombomodulin-like n=1 Tax=Hyperolius riggenbachi TaxID=752182 RepID=UPI0035A2DCBF